MQNHIRTIRKTKGLTLQELAQRCSPPTTAQTIGRLETGMRTLSVDWIERIAAALSIAPEQLVGADIDQPEAMLTAYLYKDGADAPAKPMPIRLPHFGSHVRLLKAEHSTADYQRGDILWLEDVSTDRLADYLNRNLLLPGRAGAFHYGRLAGWDGETATLLPIENGASPVRVSKPQWASALLHLVRSFA